MTSTRTSLKRKMSPPERLAQRPSPLPTIPPPRPDAPVHILSTSPVALYSDYHQSQQLPLSLILLITSFLDDVADIARVTRASKLLYYLTLPKLYETVTLRSYSEIRYKDGRAEGFGSGSPFSMALDGLVSRNTGGYVKNFRLLGSWKECGFEDFEKGRVPDNTVMLNIVVKAALEKMDRLEGFRWELNSKPLRSIYQGLGSRTHLQSLTIRFPSNRIPRPTVLMPGIPTLRSLHLIDIDPLCYPDDPSLLLLQSKKLESLKLEWSPRMRREKEPSISLHTFFGRCVRANYKIPLKSMGLKNMYARKEQEMDQAISSSTLEEVVFLNCVDPTDAATVFIDTTWSLQPTQTDFKKLKSMRIDRLDLHAAQPMSNFRDFESIYMVSPDAPQSPAPTQNGSPFTSNPGTPSTTEYDRSMVTLGAAYIAAITSRHGKSLKRLLLSNLWALSRDVLRKIVMDCPNLEQLGLAVESNDPDIVSSVLAHAPKLKAMRLLIRPDDPTYGKIMDMDDTLHCWVLGVKTVDYLQLKWLGVGPRIYHLGEVVNEKDPRTGEMRRRRIVKAVEPDDVKHIEIWGLDNLEL